MLNNFTCLILGHAHPKVLEAIQYQLPKLMTVSAPTLLEIELAEELKKRLPSIQLLRFCNSGTEATMMALRTARTYTKKSIIAKVSGNYHGTHDYAVVDAAHTSSPTASLAAGIPTSVSASIIHLPLNDISTSLKLLSSPKTDLAAILIEPVQTSYGLFSATPAYLRALYDFTRKVGALLIFDEIITFRVGYGGVQELTDVRPDLTTLGKVIGGGLPIGAFGGSAEVMSVFDPRPEKSHKGPTAPHGGTFNANPLTMAAGLAVLRQLTPDVFVRLSDMTRDFCGKLQKMFKEEGVAVHIQRAGSLFHIHFTESEFFKWEDTKNDTNQKRKELFHLTAINRGVLFAPRLLGCLSLVITEADLDEVVERLRLAVKDMLEAEQAHGKHASHL